MVGDEDIDQAESAGRATGKTTSSSVDQVVNHKLENAAGGMIAAGDAAAYTEQSHVCHDALNTTELLENILSQLLIKDLLFAQRVCKTWKICIHHSKIVPYMEDKGRG
ncbi:hypothetical protein CERZMDRAFT_98705 [Cercospora zeae-maydis SCOH1-5]|uniref:F-box domain-containing protein n=1 Tax=Cercospora zeae-maydis SCOH1-5 TaxID=717836 RepID=A0A6A6FD31_9PEZI|nr:hypothetical protein CERZMDRAFT_98705 [Cercospora zeae-maydis SCOH1-5]